MRGNIGNMMKQAQAVQQNMQKVQAEIAQLEVIGESGGGMVKVTMSGQHNVKRVQLEPAVVVADLPHPVGGRVVVMSPERSSDAYSPVLSVIATPAPVPLAGT